MTGVHNKAYNIAESISTGSCYIVLETSPPDYVQTIARYLESPVPQTRRDTTCDDPREAESDSGDSVFITQKPVPELVRTRKRHRKTPTCPKAREESEDDYLVSASPQKATTSNKKKKITKHTLPKYIFPFVKKKERMGRGFLTRQQNISLHNATMGGFFKCVRELCRGYKGLYMDVSLPTVDMDGDFIYPLSEEEEKRSEEEDIKVVEKRFLAASKAKCTKPWYSTPEKMEDHTNQQSRRRRVSSTSQDLSQDRKEMTNKRSTSRSVTTATLLFCDKDGHPCRDLPQKETGDNKHELHQTSILEQTETPKEKRRLSGGKKLILFQKNEQEEELCSNSDATVCDPLQLHGSPSEHTRGGKEAVTTVTRAQADVFQMDELSQTGQEEEEPESQSLLQGFPQWSHKKKKKKKKKAKGDHGSVEERRGQSQEEPEGLHAAASVNVEAEETFSLPDQNRPKPPAMQICEQLKDCIKNSENDTIVRQEKRDFPDSTQQKRKRKRRKLIAENIRQEVGEHLEPGVILEESETSVMCNIENAKKIKKTKGVDDAEGVEQLESTEAAATVNDEQKKRKKLKHKSMKQSSSLEDNQFGDDAKVRLSNEGVTLEERVVKKKKKKEKKASISQGVYISYTPDKRDKTEYIDSKDQDEQLSKKKKKKRRREKVDELSNGQASKETVPQSDKTVSVRKKEKRTTSSFLQADSGEKDVELHQQQNFSSKTVAPGVCDFETESAEMAGNSGDGVSKKKKKRKALVTQDNVEEDHGTEFEEPNKICGSVLTETGIKRKKRNRKKRNRSESVSVDRLDGAAARGRSQAEEDMMQKKKKKRKALVTQDNVEEDHGTEFEEPNKICGSVLTETGIKRKKRNRKKRNRSESVSVDRLDGAAARGRSQAEEDMMQKKKKKRKALVTQDNVEEDHGTEFEEPNKICGSVLTETGIKRKKRNRKKRNRKKRNRGESVSVDRLDGAAARGRSQAEEDMMQKKKKKTKEKKCKELNI